MPTFDWNLSIGDLLIAASIIISVFAYYREIHNHHNPTVLEARRLHSEEIRKSSDRWKKNFEVQPYPRGLVEKLGDGPVPAAHRQLEEDLLYTDFLANHLPHMAVVNQTSLSLYHRRLDLFEKRRRSVVDKSKELVRHRLGGDFFRFQTITYDNGTDDTRLVRSSNDEDVGDTDSAKAMNAKYESLSEAIAEAAAMDVDADSFVARCEKTDVTHRGSLYYQLWLNSTLLANGTSNFCDELLQEITGSWSHIRESQEIALFRGLYEDLREIEEVRRNAIHVLEVCHVTTLFPGLGCSYVGAIVDEI